MWPACGRSPDGRTGPVPAERPTSSVVVPVSGIDRRIVEAHHDLTAARSALAQSPCGAASTARQVVEARLDDLLDVRSDRTTARRRPHAVPVT